MSKSLKKAFMWAAAYLNIIGFILVGGYFYLKEKEDEDMQKEVKTCLIVTLIFTAINAFVALFNYFSGLFGASYSGVVGTIYSILVAVVGIGKIVTYAVFAIIALVKGKENKKEKVVEVSSENNENKDEDK